jgi:hypothetical protein
MIGIVRKKIFVQIKMGFAEQKEFVNVEKTFLVRIVL